MLLKKNKLFFKEQALFTKNDHKEWFKNYLKKKRIDYLIYLKKYKKFIGSLSYKEVNDEIQIGKYISENKFKGKNYGYEASKKWLNFGINHLGFNEVIAVTHKKNYINTNLNKKLGFKKINLKDNKWLKMIYK